jgi:hypothetical protein
MEELNRKNHWENIYQTKALNEVSWYQERPETSLYFFEKLKVPKAAKIIDIGGGDSFLVDHLLKLGYTDLSVLDISEASLERAKIRLGEEAHKVKWIVSDIVKFKPKEHYDVWHDRAAFHFLNTNTEIEDYIEIAKKNISNHGLLIVGTFSENGPLKCSGIEIKQYSQTQLSNAFVGPFKKLECFNVDHTTPFNTTQNFTFCSFRHAV